MNKKRKTELEENVICTYISDYRTSFQRSKKKKKNNSLLPSLHRKFI